MQGAMKPHGGVCPTITLSEQEHGQHEPRPTVRVVIPAKNECRQIAKCLASVLDLASYDDIDLRDFAFFQNRISGSR